jgi:hypothetical protein
VEGPLLGSRFAFRRSRQAVNRHARILVRIAILLGWTAGPSRPVGAADAFDQLDARVLGALVARTDLPEVPTLSLAAIGNLPRLVPGLRSGLVVIRTDEGNVAAVALTSALRKSPQPDQKPIPVVVLERFVTFETGSGSGRRARGQHVVLFDGFTFDLDSGQVVPKGLGGDLTFQREGETGGKLAPLAPARLFQPEKPPLEHTRIPGQPSPGKQVIPADFNGRYQLVANGQWTGALELEVGDRNTVRGRFLSDETGSVYPVTGQVAGAGTPPHQIAFACDLPRSRLEFVGFLATEGKGAIAGTVDLQGRPFGFYALRQTRSDPGPDAPLTPPGTTSP